METQEWLIEFLEFLPLEDQEINEYVSKVSTSISVNYDNEEYNLCFFALHILFMTYIYTTIWKISYVNKDRYLDSSLFARPYNGCKINFNEIKSVFEFSNLPEKDVFKFLSLIEVDNGYIGQLCKIVDQRNELAHASGRVAFDSKDIIDEEIENYKSIMSNINRKMTSTIRDWYENVLLSFSEEKFKDEYEEIEDIIQYEMIENFSLSLKELEICKDMGISKFRDRRNYSLSSDQIDKIKEFHLKVNKQYNYITGFE